MPQNGHFRRTNELVGIGANMRVLLTSSGLETKEIQDYFVKLTNMDMALVKALFIPVAAINADAIAVLPKCMNDLLKCGIRSENIKVYDMHKGMDLEELQRYDVVYICGGETHYLIQRINETGFNKTLMEYIYADGVVVGVSAGSLVFSSNTADNLGLIDMDVYVHCSEGEPRGKIAYPQKNSVRLNGKCALAIRSIPNGLEIISG